MTTDKNPATLATVKHGGCVQLGDGLLPCPFCGARAERIDFGPGSGDNESGSCVACTVCQHSGPVEFGYKENFISNWNRRALAAQPSPGGQDALLASLVARWRKDADEVGASDNTMCQKIANCTMRHAAELQAVIAARQPVGATVKDSLNVGGGQPVGKIVGYMDPEEDFILPTIDSPVVMGKITLFRSPADKWTKPLYDAPPAQAVDLPYSLDADPAGIRARVADVITGTLMVGAQGHSPPPAGHWAEPFWQAARADARVQEKTREALLAAAKSLRTIADSTKDTEFLETASEIRAYANSRANCAEQAVRDSQAVGNG